MIKNIRSKHSGFALLFLVPFFVLALCVAGTPAAHAGEGGNILDSIDHFMTNGPLAQLKRQALKNYGLAINPYFKMAFELTDNIYKSPEPDRGDVLWTYTPGINVTHTSELGEVGLSYEASFRYFSANERQNEQDQSFAAFANLYPTDKLNVKLSEELVQQGGTAGAKGIEPLNFTDNTVNVAFIYDFTDKLSKEVGYKNFSREYAGNLFDLFSYVQNELYAKGYYKLDEKTELYGGYTIGWLLYDETTNRNAVYHELPIGIRGDCEITGIHYDAYVAAHIRNQQAKNRNDFWAFIGGIELSKEIVKGTEVAVGFKRQPVESTFAAVPFYDEKVFYTNFTQRITKRLRGRADISWANRDFEDRATVGGTTVKRDDDVFSLGLGLDFAVRRWLVLNADYRVERKDSNISAFDYTENRFVLGMTMPV